MNDELEPYEVTGVEERTEKIPSLLNAMMTVVAAVFFLALGCVILWALVRFVYKYT